jgi:hypothetical protein
MRETAKPYMVRLYKKQRKILKNRAKIENVSEAEIIRRGIEATVS